MLTLWVAVNPTFLRCKFRRAFDRRAASRTARRHLTSRELGFRGSPGTRTRTRALGATARDSRPPRKRGTILCWRFFRGCQSPLGPPPRLIYPRDGRGGRRSGSRRVEEPWARTGRVRPSGARRRTPSSLGCRCAPRRVAFDLGHLLFFPPRILRRVVSWKSEIRAASLRRPASCVRASDPTPPRADAERVFTGDSREQVGARRRRAPGEDRAAVRAALAPQGQSKHQKRKVERGGGRSGAPRRTSRSRESAPRPRARATRTREARARAPRRAPRDPKRRNARARPPPTPAARRPDGKNNDATWRAVGSGDWSDRFDRHFLTSDALSAPAGWKKSDPTYAARVRRPRALSSFPPLTPKPPSRFPLLACPPLKHKSWLSSTRRTVSAGPRSRATSRGARISSAWAGGGATWTRA